MNIDGLSAYKMNSSNITANKEESSALQTERVKPREQQQDEQQKVKRLLEEAEKKEITKEEAEQIVNGINEFLQPTFTSLSFKLHDKLDRYYVEVINRETKEVIREIPEKELLDMYAKMTEFLGLFIDKKL